ERASGQGVELQPQQQVKLVAPAREQRDISGLEPTDVMNEFVSDALGQTVLIHPMPTLSTVPRKTGLPSLVSLLIGRGERI
ncbi:MAG TPA: hypothetical protein VFU69_07750, partial [Ktedonobacterales bacterium]|nr:hypothetical protein [Ktedonobacterales bacterium]